MKKFISKIFEKKLTYVQGVDLASGPDHTTYLVPPNKDRERFLVTRLANPTISDRERKQLVELLERRRVHNRKVESQ